MTAIISGDVVVDSKVVKSIGNGDAPTGEVAGLVINSGRPESRLPPGRWASALCIKD